MRVELILFDADDRCTSQRMHMMKDGYFDCETDGIAEGQRYAFRLDGKEPRPDPSSRWQPDGIHRASAVFRPSTFEWSDGDWRGIRSEDLVICDVHPATFSSEGTFDAIVPRLKSLRDHGSTAIAFVADSETSRGHGWGYDGDYWFAVQETFGGPRGLQRLVDACHRSRLAAILAVNYTHFGPDGNCLNEFGPYFTDVHQTPSGSTINYDGPSCRAVRDLVLQNVHHWIQDFHFDGLRLEAVHAILDDSPTHILSEIGEVAAAVADRLRRPIHILNESWPHSEQALDASERGG